MTLVPSTLFRFIKQMNCLTRSNASIKMTNIATKYIGNNGWRNSDFNRRFIFSHATEDYIKLMGKDLHVNPGFGVLHANGTVDLLIKPTNPQSSKIFCEVQIPIKYDLDVKLLDDASVQILGMEADEVNVSTVNGEINTHGLKSHNIHVNTEHGHITSEGTMQGNIFINAKTTKLKAKRLQGLILDIEAEELSTAVESSYMNQGQISAHRGDIIINNLHGCTDLLIKQGQVVITGFHGQISGFVGSGKVDVHVTDVTGNSTLHLNEGSLVLSVLENPRHDLEVTATSLDISKEIKSAGTTASGSSQTFNLVKNDNAEASILKATVLNGSAQVKYQDWFSTLGIKM
ncbi:protein FAM185A-like [Homarus americanus]|uniref:Protein FAM185A-like n=1 Tax=Homarus americanus TaxID=6706 RepID=A0A8J5JJP6_HOMAM|nr:protein FAM185A-like [Homarus americanus]